MSGLIAKDIVVEFNKVNGQKVRILDQVNLSIEPHQIVGLTDPSGRGKTTLARIMAGLSMPTHGEVICDGICVHNIHHNTNTKIRGKIGMVFQSPRRSCDPRLTLKKTIMQTAHADIDLEKILSMVALTSDLLNRYPKQVSDGQLQRVAIARTLATQPDYIILDEMTAMLDPATTAILIDVVQSFVHQGGGALMISHDHELINVVANKIVSL